MNKDFQWTTELVKEFGTYFSNSVGSWDKCVYSFVASKSTEQINWEIIEFRMDFMQSKNVAFTLGRDEKYSTGLNGRIFAFSRDSLINEMATINSVRRLSDNEVFSIGDKIDMDECRWKPIDAFLVGGKGKESGHSENEIWISTNKNKGYGTLLQYACKLPKHTNERPPIVVMPRWEHTEIRLQELDEAIMRYTDAKEFVPIGWIAESYELRTWLQNWKKEKSLTTPSV